MKTYTEYQEEEQQRNLVDPRESQVWRNFTQSAEELVKVLGSPGTTLHELIFNDIEHRLAEVKAVLDRLDIYQKWRAKIVQRGGRLA